MAKIASKVKNKPYPLIDGHRKHYMRYPILVTDKVLKDIKGKTTMEPKVGQYISVNVLKKGYAYIISGIPSDTEEFCKRCCDIHNNYHGWTKKEVLEMVSKSMGLNKVKKKRKNDKRIAKT